MMRKLNSYLCPYILVVVVDSDSPRCTLEDISCTERFEVYIFAVKVFGMSPGRRRKEDILVVFADGRLDASILEQHHTDLPNAKFSWDQCHLFSNIWLEQFGSLWDDNVVSHMKKLLYANSRDEFLNYLSEIIQVYEGNVFILNTVKDVSSQSDQYVEYVLESTEGTLGEVSNNCMEQNHSGFVHWVGIKLYKEHGYDIKQLLGRQMELKKSATKRKVITTFRFSTRLVWAHCLYQITSYGRQRNC